MRPRRAWAELVGDSSPTATCRFATDPARKICRAHDSRELVTVRESASATDEAKWMLAHEDRDEKMLGG